MNMNLSTGDRVITTVEQHMMDDINVVHDGFKSNSMEGDVRWNLKEDYLICTT